MARDNGSRGSYRHTNAAEPKARTQQALTLGSAIKPSFDENAAPEARATLEERKNLDSSMIDHLSDNASDLLNANFPPMGVPGSMYRRQADFSRSFGKQLATSDWKWKDLALAIVFYGLAGIGFMTIMCDGVGAIGGFLLQAGAHLMHEIMLALDV
ncbi:hypothetical protein VPNG_06592 [Cytospora leucostoma]|uniref:Uncharacterized protein n=1 Tax=Cytospora leucostoma TaxID=1230097 RepID=A0A423WU48_9PEZI|nr:hypothetical protein VPNG_06592 [Cytospora leucostoma]